MTAALAAAQARVAEIQARIAPPAGRPSTAASFGAALASASAPASASASASAPSAAPPSADVVAAAERYLGVPYLWGGTDPAQGLDCSGFVQRVYRDLGVELPRVSRDQARAGTPVASLREARPGDLVAFNSPVDHIGIYAGEGRMLVAPRRGDVVKYQEIYGTPTAIRRILPAGSAPVDTTPRAAPAAGPAGPSPYRELFEVAGARHGVDPALLTAVARAESAFDPRAVSPAGARGLMQLMPATAASLDADPFDPASAIDGAARLLSSHLRRFGSTELALAAYNAGPGAVARHGGIPPYRETQGYVRRIMSELTEVR